MLTLYTAGDCEYVNRNDKGTQKRETCDVVHIVPTGLLRVNMIRVMPVNISIVCTRHITDNLFIFSVMPCNSIRKVNITYRTDEYVGLLNMF